MILSSHLLDEHAQVIGLAPIRRLGQGDEVRPDVHEIEQAPQDGGGALRSGHLLGEASSGIVTYRHRGEDWFQFICATHQRASREATDIDNVIAVCPRCEAEREDEAGRLRYRLLQLRLQVEG